MSTLRGPLRQSAILRHFHTSTLRFTSTTASSTTSTAASIVTRVTPELDPSFAPLLNDIHMAPRRGSSSSTGTLPLSSSTSHSASTSTPTSAPSSSASSSPSTQHLHSSLSHTVDPTRPSSSHTSNTSYPISDESGFDDDWDGSEIPREERKSPAALLGSKRIGTVVIPESLSDAIQARIDESNPRDIRAAFLEHRASLPTTSPTPSPSSSTSTFSQSARRADRAERKTAARARATPEHALAKAAAYLPGEYAAVRNVVRELDKRFGQGWVGERVLEVSGGLGAGCWAVAEGDGEGVEQEEGEVQGEVNAEGEGRLREGREYTLVHKSRHGLDLAQTLMQASPQLQSATLKRDLSQVIMEEPPSLVMSTFHLSTLPTAAGRLTHLRHLLALSPSLIVLVDRSTPLGWSAISEARTFLLSQSTPEDPLHTVAPCPHDGPCPLVGMREPCAFSQRLQRPGFVRRTKHSTKGDEDARYTYLVVKRGKRPVERGEAGDVRVNGEVGRIGGVGREEEKRSKVRLEGMSELREVEGGEFEMVEVAGEGEVKGSSMGQEAAEVDEVRGVGKEGVMELGEEREEVNDMVGTLREEAYAWPRLVAPPLKRSGHVVMDACCSSGSIQRLTFPRSHSKQGYYDARKASWGDLFPHDPKGKAVVRTRGVRRLTKVDGVAGEEAGGGVGGEEVEELLRRLGAKEVRAEVVEEVEGGEGAGDWTSSDGRVTVRHSALGRRGMSTIANVGTLSTLSSPRPSVQPVRLDPVSRRSMSARPSQRTSSIRPKVTLADLRRMAASGIPITCLTAYDFPTALLSQSSGVDMVLVGDSLSQVALGHSSTTGITLDEMIHHARAVTRGAVSPFVVVDMPFGSFEVSVEEGVKAVIRVIKESGADAVKIEGGKEIVPLVKRLSEMGIPVIPHLGLQPQRATALSGYLVQAKTSDSAVELYETAQAMDEAGAVGILIEAVPHAIATEITNRLVHGPKASGVFTIGIGAGPGTSGQVLVITDVLGTYAGLEAQGDGSEEEQKRPRFVRQFGEAGRLNRKAVEGFVESVKGGTFPIVGKETYGMKKDELEKFMSGEMRVSEGGAVGGEGGKGGGRGERRGGEEGGEGTEDGQ